MQPNPMDILKKASPIAMSTTEPSIREKSGMNRNFRPSIALGKVRLRIQTTTSRMNKSGIRMRVAFSMPPDAPRRMTEAVSPSTSHCQNSDFHGQASRDEKASLATAGSCVCTLPVRALGI